MTSHAEVEQTTTCESEDSVHRVLALPHIFETVIDMQARGHQVSSYDPKIHQPRGQLPSRILGTWGRTRVGPGRWYWMAAIRGRCLNSISHGLELVESGAMAEGFASSEAGSDQAAAQYIRNAAPRGHYFFFSASWALEPYRERHSALEARGNGE